MRVQIVRANPFLPIDKSVNQKVYICYLKMFIKYDVVHCISYDFSVENGRSWVQTDLIKKRFYYRLRSNIDRSRCLKSFVKIFPQFQAYFVTQNFHATSYLDEIRVKIVFLISCLGSHFHSWTIHCSYKNGAHWLAQSARTYLDKLAYRHSKDCLWIQAIW